jgi:hypothetical protein
MKFIVISHASKQLNKFFIYSYIMNEVYSNWPRLQAVKQIILFIATQKINKHTDQLISYNRRLTTDFLMTIVNENISFEVSVRVAINKLHS